MVQSQNPAEGEYLDTICDNALGLCSPALMRITTVSHLLHTVNSKKLIKRKLVNIPSKATLGEESFLDPVRNR